MSVLILHYLLFIIETFNISKNIWRPLSLSELTREKLNEGFSQYSVL